MFEINNNWRDKLSSVLSSEKYKNLISFLNNEYNTKNIYPKLENVFNAINSVDYDDVKVVIIGQDPYHQPNQAHGFSFSVQEGIALPPSLRNIYKEIEDDLGIKQPNLGNLTSWVKQGVLMLNAVLTVEQSMPNSHKNKGWEEVTTEIIKQLNMRDKPIVFLLWGNFAKSFSKYITNKNHYVLTANHPSPMSANRGGWFGCKHFSATNNILKSIGQNEIDWRIK